MNYKMGKKKVFKWVRKCLKFEELVSIILRIIKNWVNINCNINITKNINIKVILYIAKISHVVEAKLNITEVQQILRKTIILYKQIY